ncbi:glucan endo-1-3-beta-glucosidase eglC [Penicillium sp. IBT 16267x]|nr:glucan endo-1-3-beta-glucosidase eglC [Penicillium sp. IBT 16267x]
MQMKQILALALSIASAEATYKGFNYGSTNEDGSTRYKADFVSQFQNAKNLVGTSGFTSARLYTMIQDGTTNTPIEAIEAAIEEETSLLLGLWTSGGNIDNEIAALKSAISTYGTSLTKLVVGISVGSEDLYRNSVTGEEADAGIGMNPDALIECIESVKTAISGTALSSATVGHVDTWNAWANSSNSAVISQIDWLGVDTYPYFQTTDANSIDNAANLFEEAIANTKAVAGGKEIWITETGWPVTGPNENEAVASVANAKKYWDTVGCSLFGNTNTWWYIQQDYGASPSFGIVGETLTTTPLFDLTCPNSTSTSTSTSATTSSTGMSSGESTGSSVSSSSGAKVSGSSAGRYGNGTAVVSGFRSVSASSPMATGSGSSSTGSSSSSSGMSGSSSSSSSSASASTTAYSAATRPAGSIFGAIVAALALAIAV